MNHISQIVIGVALLSCTAVCASEVFGMCDPSRPRGNNEALTALKRRKHVYCEPRLRLLWDFQSVAAILATAVTILAGRSAEAVAMIVAVVMFAIWDGGRPPSRIDHARADPLAGPSRDSDQPADGGALRSLRGRTSGPVLTSHYSLLLCTSSQ